MRTSESIAKIAPALVKAQAACVSVTKDKTGNIETKSGAKYSYKYADFAAVVEQLKPALRDNGLAMLQWAQREQDGITVITRVQHESGEWQETDTFIPLAIASAQAFGSALTYGKRYGAQAFMLLPSDDDDGAEATQNPAKPADRKDSARQVAVDAFDDLSAETQDLMRSHAAELGKLHAKRGDVITYLAEQNFDNEAKLALWSLLPAPVRSWIKDQEKIARANGIGRAMQNTHLASQP